MEPKALQLVGTFKNNNLSVDTKVTQLLGLKSDIKQKNVPEGAVVPIFESLRLAIASPHFALLAAGFSTLNHFLKRLFIQGQHDIVSLHARVLYPHLIERLGDNKERVRAQAAQAFSELWPASNADVEECVLGVALKSKSPRSKQAALIWLESMHNTHVILFRNYVHDIVACLENADASVRDQAKSTVLTLFENAPANAKADLLAQMTSVNVRKSIADPILKALGLESEIQASRPPSRGDALYNRPPSRGDALHNRPPSRGDALHNRPPSRGDALHNRPPSRGDALHNRPPSRGDALHNRPPSRGDALHNRPPSRGDALHNRPPSRGDVLRLQQSANVTSAASMSAQDDTELQCETPPLLVKPIPIRPHQSPARGGQTRALKDASASVDPPSGQSTPKPTFAHLDEDGAFGVSTSQQVPDDSTSKDGYQEPTKRQLDKCEVAPYKITPRDVASTRDLDSVLREISPPFQGRETEDNWMQRFHGLLTLRRVTVGNAPHEFPQAFIAAIKVWLDNIFKVVLSLRTSMITMGCFMVEDLARVLGPRLDPMIDIFMQNLMKLCMSMKKLVGSIGNTTVEVMIKNLTRNSRLLSHVTTAAQEKNVNLRLYGASWIKIIITQQTEHKLSAEGVNNIETCIRKSLVDANPGVREATRSTFWAFHGVWPKRANRILSDLDTKTRNLLEKDPSNPNIDPFASNFASSKTGLSNSTSAISGRSAPKAAEGKRATLVAPTKSLTSSPRAQHTALPDAMSVDRHRKPPATTTSRAVPRGTNTSSLTSAPMRPGGAPKQRPAPIDIARPATATDFHSNPPESPSRVSVANPSPLTRQLGATRPRQKSDPLQDASPTKIRAPKFDVDADSADQPFGTLHIPKARATSNEQKQDEEIAPKPRVLSIEVPTRSLSDEKNMKYDVEEPVKDSIEFAAHPINDERKEVQPGPRRVSVEVVVPPIDVEQDFHDDSEQFVPRRKISLEFGPGMRALEKDEENILPRIPSVNVDARRVSSTHKASGVFEAAKVNNDEDLPELRVDNRSVSRADEMPMPDLDRILSTLIPSRRKVSNRLVKAEISKRRNISPRSQDIVQARQMLVKGVERIRAREMDITGYRKLQQLIEFHDLLFVDEEQFDFMLLALIDELQAPIPSKDAKAEFNTTWDLKLQVIITLRHMFDHANKYFIVHYPFTVVALLRAIRDLEKAPTVVEGLETLLHSIVAVCEPADTMNAVVDVLETEDQSKDVEFISLRKGLEVLVHLLVRVNVASTLEEPPAWSKLENGTLEHVGTLAGRALGIEQVRRETVTVCIQLRNYVRDDTRLWTLLRSPSQAARGLITYYLMRKH